jgi:serine/threonine-protein kinase
VLHAGATFAAYEVRGRIAVGGMGEVYLCWHRLLDRLDAVKILRPHLAADDGFRRRFLQEAHSAARLRHPNVVSVYTADEFDGLLYLAMEYVAGEDLTSLLRRCGRLAPARALRLLGAVADALDTAHRAQLVHRDIKPSNLLVTSVGTPDESVTLVDFGISRMLDADSEITRTGEIVGTIAYCAPEQLSRRGIDGSCDQYALACVAYECLTGEVPYPREGQLAIMTAHLTAPPPVVTAIRPDLPAAVDSVIARAMAKEARQRFATCVDFVEALRAALAPAVPQTHPDFPAPDELAARMTRPAIGQPGLLRPVGHVDTLAVRLGWQPEPALAPGRPGPLVLSLLAGPLAVRGGGEATAGCIRWLLAQMVARHRRPELCLACAAAPSREENWLWVNWLPHARPDTAPLSGPHVATAVDTAADLLDRLGGLVAQRRAAPAASPPGPRVLAVLDTRLEVRTDDPRLDRAERAGVHIVYRLPADEPAPPHMSTLDLLAERPACRLRRSGFPPEPDAVPDLVSTAYVRALAGALPDA